MFIISVRPDKIARGLVARGFGKYPSSRVCEVWIDPLLQQPPVRGPLSDLTSKHLSSINLVQGNLLNRTVLISKIQVNV